ncbi:hypothetical protein ACKI1I_00250 [Streptomyces turgidiscabies]|nr:MULTISPECIES: hypothetical protein [Streptomyces]MDX3492690.1 hypothetical protein [Streptomyces turgidiscabies]
MSGRPGSTPRTGATPKARAFVEARVDELCQRRDDAARLGLARRS